MRTRHALGRLTLALLLATSSLSAQRAPALANATATEAASRVCALLNNGFLDVYAGTPPDTADTALSGQLKLAGFTFAATACSSTTNGVATFAAIGDDVDADASGTAAFFRATKSDHTTVVVDGSVCTSGCDLNLASTNITIHAHLTISTMTITAVKS